MAKETDSSALNKKFSSEFFNATWDLIEKLDRSEIDTERMIHLAHASLAHWMKRPDCSDQNLSIGYWLLSRVYAEAGEPENAMKNAERCLNLSQKKNVAKVYLGYAYEALARSAKLAGDEDKRRKFITKAEKIAESLEKDDKDQLETDPHTI